MNNSANNGFSHQLDDYETPFADIKLMREEPSQAESPGKYFSNYLPELENPFSRTYELSETGSIVSPLAGDFVQFLGELEDAEFSNNLNELADELEDTWTCKISNELAMGERLVPFATQQAAEYFRPLLKASDSMIDRVSHQFSGNDLADHSETDIERFFNETDFYTPDFSPAQEQFFGSLVKKVKSVVKKGIDFAKKGVNVLGKFLPMNIILNKLKALIKPLLDKVLKSAIGKLPKSLQPHAQTLAKKFLNIDTPAEKAPEENGIPASGQLDAVETELDNHIANLIFSPNESEADNFVMDYEASSETFERNIKYETGGLNIPTLDVARQQFINELNDLQSGENPAPAIERFLPAAIMALRPVIKAAVGIIGRQKIINFLAGLLAKLVGKYVPDNVSKPLAAKIIDVGMNAIGFETSEVNKPDVAYEAIANTIQETIQNMQNLNESVINDNEALTMDLLEAFETAAANNFPSQYIKEELHTTKQPGVWILKPRNGPRQMYKKYSQVFNVTITPQNAKTIKTIRDLPIANFLRDKLSLDPAKPIQARVHLYETIGGTKLYHISKHENVNGMNPPAHGRVQLHPLSKQAAALLLNEPALGKESPKKFTANRTNIGVGQRFYFLEINGARLRTNNIPRKNTGSNQGTARGTNRPAQSGDIRGVLNFVKSEIRFNYYLSEEESKSVVEKLNRNDFLGAATGIRYSVRDVLREILLQNITTKVKIIHEAFPEMFLENYFDQEENNAALSSGKELLTNLVEKLCGRLSGFAYQAAGDFFKSRAAEFKQAQAEPKDGVTIKIAWSNVVGMSSIKAAITALRSNQSAGNPAQLHVPNLPKAEVQIVAGKEFN